MQFEMNHNVSEQACKVTFLHPEKVKKESWKVLDEIFSRLGANQCDNASYLFPSFITSQVLQEVIHNTSCYECGGLMKDSTAFQNTLVSSDDFGNDAGERGSTQSRIGEAMQIKVRKCSVCGHSHT